MVDVQADRCGRGLEVRPGALWFGVKEMCRPRFFKVRVTASCRIVRLLLELHLQQISEPDSRGTQHLILSKGFIKGCEANA